MKVYRLALIPIIAFTVIFSVFASNKFDSKNVFQQTSITDSTLNSESNGGELVDYPLTQEEAVYLLLEYIYSDKEHISKIKFYEN